MLTPVLLYRRIWAAVVVAKDGNYTVTSGKIVGLFVALLVIVRDFFIHLLAIRPTNSLTRTPCLRQHGILNSVATKWLARFTVGFVFINVGTTILIIIVLLACTSKDNMHSAGYAPFSILVYGG